MGNCNCLERGRVAAWGGDDWPEWGSPDERSGGVQGMKENGDAGGTRVKIRMTKGQLRRLLEGAGRGSAVEDVVAEIMSVGTVRVDVADRQAERCGRPPKLETIQEDMVE